VLSSSLRRRARTFSRSHKWAPRRGCLACLPFSLTTGTDPRQLGACAHAAGDGRLPPHEPNEPQHRLPARVPCACARTRRGAAMPCLADAEGCSSSPRSSCRSSSRRPWRALCCTRSALVRPHVRVPGNGRRVNAAPQAMRPTGRTCWTLSRPLVIAVRLCRTSARAYPYGHPSIRRGHRQLHPV
jgi:hypothetical protein